MQYLYYEDLANHVCPTSNGYCWKRKETGRQRLPYSDTMIPFGIIKEGTMGSHESSGATRKPFGKAIKSFASPQDFFKAIKELLEAARKFVGACRESSRKLPQPFAEFRNSFGGSPQLINMMTRRCSISCIHFPVNRLYRYI